MPPKPMRPDLSRKIELVLKALSLSRGRVAFEMGVDKSLVSRWVSGTNTPSAHNLAGLTALVAQRRPGFSTLDWDRDLGGLATAMGVEAAIVADPAATGAAGPLIPGLTAARRETAANGEAYEGHWRCLRHSFVQQGLFFAEPAWIRRRGELLAIDYASQGAEMSGWMLPMHGKLVVVVADAHHEMPAFLMLNGVVAAHAERLDGLCLGGATDPARTIVAAPMVLERVGELSEDVEADRAVFQRACQVDHVIEAGLIDPAVRERLTAGGDPTLRMSGAASLSLGGRRPTRLISTP